MMTSFPVSLKNYSNQEEAYAGFYCHIYLKSAAPKPTYLFMVHSSAIGFFQVS
jgi:hypothetical protein